MGCDSCTAGEPRWLIGARTWAGKVATVASGGTGWSRGDALHGAPVGLAELLAFLASPWCFTTCFPVDSIDEAQDLNVK